MKVKWLGHACFLLTSQNGTRVLTDPFDENVGYKLPELEVDIVTTSHDHYDHNNVSVVNGDFVHINKTGSYNIKGIDIEGISSYHDQDKGSQRGKNIIFRYRIDNLRVCHLGDLGHMLTKEQAEKIGSVDILLIPVGGRYTIDYNVASEVKKLLKPAITIPMHYKTPALSFQIDDVSKFLSAVGGGKRMSKQEIEIKNLDDYKGVIVLDYE